jgi:ATP-dependent protease ClpP protease subunit
MDLENIHTRNIDVENRRIYLHGDSPIKDEEPGVDYRMANMFIKNMDILENNNSKDITICMGTVGGEWNYGMSIYDRIKSAKCPTTIIAYAWARSMSSIILQAATHRLLMPHCDFMVHYGTITCEGHYITVKSGMKHDELSEKIMLRIYAERCQTGKFFIDYKMSVEQIMVFIDQQIKEKGDWWLSSSEAVHYGFADAIVNF